VHPVGGDPSSSEDHPTEAESSTPIDCLAAVALVPKADR